MSSEATIRLAKREDIPEILAMINELAGFENASSSVLATEESLSKTLSFAPSSDAQTAETLTSPGYAKTFLLTSPEGSIAGMALFFHNYSTWRAAPGVYLEDLFVRPAYRRRGYATLLLRELAREVVRTEGGRLEWACLKWNENALKFYRALGAETMDEWVGLRVDGERLKELAEKEITAKDG